MVGIPFTVIIPARFSSSRFPGKPLAMLRGASGEPRSLIRRTWDCAQTIADPADIWVATDDERIADALRSFGAQVAMTSANCRNGTERCADALDVIGSVKGIVVNLQGDAPLTPPMVAEALVSALAMDPAAAMATPAMLCSPGVLAHLVADQAAGRVGGTTVVVDRDHYALYFSKRVIPHLPPGHSDAQSPVRLHLGVYAYRPEALRAYGRWSPSLLEEAEGLEQLRFLENRELVRVVDIPTPDWDPIELNNPEDVPMIEAALATRGVA